MAKNILIVHNNYTKRGGEESVVDFQIKLFEARGDKVTLYTKNNNDNLTLSGKIKQFANGFYNKKSQKEIEQIILSNDKFDACIIHNLYHQITPSVLHTLKKHNVPVIMVLHNYRLLCPIAILHRDGQECRKCVDNKLFRELNCIRYNCSGSFFNSTFYSLRSIYVRFSKIVAKNVTAFVCLSDFTLHLFQKYGFDHLSKIPNAIQLPTKESEPMTEKTYFAFVGRLTKEKGIDIFFRLAQLLPEYDFKVAGDKSVIPADLDAPENIEFCGFLSGNELSVFYSNAKALFIGSRWSETFLLTAAEAFTYKTGVILPNGQSYSHFADNGRNGLMYDEDKFDALISAIRGCTMSDWRAFGENGYRYIEKNFSVDNYYDLYINLINRLQEK